MEKTLPKGLLKLVRPTRMLVDMVLKRREKRNKPFRARHSLETLLHDGGGQ